MSKTIAENNVDARIYYHDSTMAMTYSGSKNYCGFRQIVTACGRTTALSIFVGFLKCDGLFRESRTRSAGCAC
jgi:hypothetical protein